jgi:hypothetical protein
MPKPVRPSFRALEIRDQRVGFVRRRKARGRQGIARGRKQLLDDFESFVRGEHGKLAPLVNELASQRPREGTVVPRNLRSKSAPREKLENQLPGPAHGGHWRLTHGASRIVDDVLISDVPAGAHETADAGEERRGVALMEKNEAAIREIELFRQLEDVEISGRQISLDQRYVGEP